MTYNGEVACWCKLPVEFEGAITAAPLLSLLEKLAEDELEINVGDGELLVKGRGREAGVRMQAEVVLPIDAVERPTGWQPLHEDFCEAINTVAACAGKDDSGGFFVTCVHITPTHVEACDNWQIARYPLDTPIKEKALVKRDHIKHIVDLDMTKVSETKNWIHFKNPSGLVLSCRRYVDEFPDLSPFLDCTGRPATLPGSLGDAVDKAQIFSADNAQNDNVTIEIRPDKMRISGRGASGWYKEQRSIKYDGPPIQFMIAPKILTEISKRHTDCILAKGRLKVEGGKFTYVTCLSEEPNGNGKAANGGGEP
jgi:hypothetical protein